MSTVTSVNPYNGETINTYTHHSEKEIESFIDVGHERFLLWKKVSYEERAELLKSLASVLNKNKKNLLKDLE